MNSFEDLDAYNECRSLRNSIWEFTKTLHKEETYRLKDQLIRASRSVTANKAEGYGRFHYQENIQFCRQARGSIYETLDHLICAFNCQYISESDMKNFREKIIISLKMLNGYISYLKKAKDSIS
jgi:four helix bundle protein